MPPSAMLMADVQVKNKAAGVYQVQLFPVNCSSPFPMMAVRNSVGARVVNKKRASPPVSGTFDVEYSGISLQGSSASHYCFLLSLDLI